MIMDDDIKPELNALKNNGSVETSIEVRSTATKKCELKEKEKLTTTKA